MRKSVLFAAAAAVMVAAPAIAAPKAPVPTRSHSDRLTTMLDLRLRSIELQIDVLRDRGSIGGEEAQDLRQEARRLERRLQRLPERQAGEVELAVNRLQRQLRFAADDGRFASLRRDLGRFDDGDRYERDRGRDYEGDSYRRADSLGDPFAIWKERDERGPH